MTKRLVGLGVLAALTAAFGYIAVVPPLPFNKAVWLAREQLPFDELHIRGRMAEYLVSTNALMGKSHNEVVALLGPPPPTDKFSDWDLVYWLCPDRGVGIDSEWLVMNFDDAGKVSSVRLMLD